MNMWCLQVCVCVCVCVCVSLSVSLCGPGHAFPPGSLIKRSGPGACVRVCAPVDLGSARTHRRTAALRPSAPLPDNARRAPPVALHSHASVS